MTFKVNYLLYRVVKLELQIALCAILQKQENCFSPKESIG